jgi:ligand-binding SRPBCC domain-containing protein
MRVHRLSRQQRVEAGVDEVFAFFAQARNLEAITPPWLSFEVLSPDPIEMRVGAVIDYGLRLHGIPLWWQSRIEVWEPGVAFVDAQVRGPYRLWRHRHEFEAVGEATLVRDIVDYALPFGVAGEAAHWWVRRDLRRIFDHRRSRVAQLLEGAGRPVPAGAGAGA